MPGEPFGLGENGVYLNSACALTDCLLIRVPRAELDALCAHEPRLQQDCLVGAMAQLRLSQRHLLIVTHQRVLKRVADFLLECSRQQEVFDRSGVLPTCRGCPHLFQRTHACRQTCHRRKALCMPSLCLQRRFARLCPQSGRHDGTQIRQQEIELFSKQYRRTDFCLFCSQTRQLPKYRTPL